MAAAASASTATTMMTRALESPPLSPSPVVAQSPSPSSEADVSRPDTHIPPDRDHPHSSSQSAAHMMVLQMSAAGVGVARILVGPGAVDGVGTAVVVVAAVLFATVATFSRAPSATKIVAGVEAGVDAVSESTVAVPAEAAGRSICPARTRT